VTQLPDFAGPFLRGVIDGVLGLLRQPAVILTLAVMVVMSIMLARRRRRR
jgi:hypothetical protein